MRYENTVDALFLERLNRFTANVSINGVTETVHVKNTGRCRELLLPGAKVILVVGNSSSRKTRYDLITVWKDGLGWVNIDSQASNTVVFEWLKGPAENRPQELRKLTCIKPEYTYGSSRIDFYLETPNEKILLEVKGCTLEVNGKGYFPDAPTERGIKHLKELSFAVKNGYSSYLAFVIAMPGISEVLPNVKTHPEFGDELTKAKNRGVKVLFLQCDVKQDSLMIERWS